ncbi:hypothetical protein Tco_0777397 [Tanacetum coccineum]
MMMEQPLVRAISLRKSNNRTRCRNGTSEIAGRSKDGLGPELVASMLLGDEGAATTSKVVKVEPHSYSQLRIRRNASEKRDTSKPCMCERVRKHVRCWFGGTRAYQDIKLIVRHHDGPLMELPEVACDSKVQSHRNNSGETGMSKGRPGPESSTSS